MHWGGGGGHGDQVSSEMDGDWAPIHPESVSWNCAGWKLLSVAHGASSTEATGPERRSNRGIRTRGSVVLNSLRPRSFHFFCICWKTGPRRLIPAKVSVRKSWSFSAIHGPVPQPGSSASGINGGRKTTHLLFVFYRAPFFRGKVFPP